MNYIKLNISSIKVVCSFAQFIRYDQIKSENKQNPVKTRSLCVHYIYTNLAVQFCQIG